MSSGARYKTDMDQFGLIKERTWKAYPKLKKFEEGYDKDYIYEKRSNIPFLDLNEKNLQTVFDLKSKTVCNKKYEGSRDIILLTIQGAIKFNHRKRSEGGDMIADALIEMDYKMMLQVKDEKKLFNH